MNGILIVDKPAEWTSHDVVGKLRGVLKERRIGHGGTLDPMATGVLPVFVGRATRAVQFCEEYDKEYDAALRLGLVTNTQDITGEVLERRPVTATAEELAALLPRFTGEIEQLPPMYSAVKIGGKKLYELARKGVEVARRPRPITVHALALLGREENGDFRLHIRCSKGTYIRTLCHDLGAALGCGGVMSALTRTRVGPFRLEDAVKLSVLAAPGMRPGDALIPVDRLFSHHPAVTVGAEAAKICRNGAPFPLAASIDPGLCRVYDEDGGFLMLGRYEGGVMYTVKSFFEV